MIRPFVMGMLEYDKRDGLSIIVMLGKKDIPFEDLPVAWDESFGNNPGKAPEIAMDKAKTSWKTGRSSRAVSESAWLLADNMDRVWPGSLCFTDENTGMRMVVAVSGLPARHDEMVARMVLEAIDAVSDDIVKNVNDCDGIYRTE